MERKRSLQNAKERRRCSHKQSGATSERQWRSKSCNVEAVSHAYWMTPCILQPMTSSIPYSRFLSSLSIRILPHTDFVILVESSIFGIFTHLEHRFGSLVSWIAGLLAISILGAALRRRTPTTRRFRALWPWHQSFRCLRTAEKSKNC